MADFTIQITDRHAIDYLARVQARLGDLSHPMTGIARAMRNLTEDAFQAERSPFGAPWAPLSERSTIPRREASGHWPGPLLQVSGGLAASITSGSDRDSAWVGAGKEYAAMMQFGGKRAEFPHLWGDIPARPFIPVDADGNIPDALRDEIFAIMEDWLTP